MIDILTLVLTVLVVIAILYMFVMILLTIVDFSEKRFLKRRKEILEDFAAYINMITPQEITEVQIDTYMLYYMAKGDFNKKNDVRRTKNPS